MSFRTVEITGPAELHIKNGSLVIEKEIKEIINTKDVVDFPDGLMFVGTDDSLQTRRVIKSIRLKDALKYAKQAQNEGRYPTQE